MVHAQRLFWCATGLAVLLAAILSQEQHGASAQDFGTVRPPGEEGGSGASGASSSDSLDSVSSVEAESLDSLFSEDDRKRR